MANLTFTCPHCGAVKNSMKIIGHYDAPEEFVKSQSNPPFGGVFSYCGNYFNPICAKIFSSRFYNASHYSMFRDEFHSALNKDYSIEAGSLASRIVKTPHDLSDIPSHLSDAVSKAFRSAERNYVAEDGEDAAAMLYRRSIDIAIREKHPEIKGNLAPRIAKLADQGFVPPAMKDWADQIRLIGNYGAHEPEQPGDEVGL